MHIYIHICVCLRQSGFVINDLTRYPKGTFLEGNQLELASHIKTIISDIY